MIDFDKLHDQLRIMLERELVVIATDHGREQLDRMLFPSHEVAARLAYAVVRDVLAEEKRLRDEMALEIFRDQATQAAAAQPGAMVFTPTSFTCPCGHVISGQPGELNIQSHTIDNHSELWLDRAQMVSSEIAGHVLTCEPARKVIARVRML